MNMDPLLWQLLLLALLIFFSAIFSSAEIAFLTVNKIKLEKLSADGNINRAHGAKAPLLRRRAKRILDIAKKPARFLPVIQVGNTLAGFLASAFAAESLSGRLSAALAQAGTLAKIPVSADVFKTIALVLITMVLSFCNIVFGELVPKRVALQKAEKLCFLFSGFILFASRLFSPAVWFLGKATNLFLRLFQVDPDAEEHKITEEEIRLLVDAGSERGAIAVGEKEIIHNVFEFNDKTAEEVMTHRRDAILLWLKEDDESWEKTITESRHNYFPVCGDTVDDICGVLCARDYLELKDKSRSAAMEKAVRPAQLVPGTVQTNVLFRKMKTRRNHFALVLDEYGCLDGIITMNDLLECLVGDIAEEEDKAGIPLIERKGPNVWKLSGAASLEKLEKATGVSLSKAVNNCDTFGGFVFTLLGRIPDDGETCDVNFASEGATLNIAITEVKERRLVSSLVRLEKT
jgi:putative hemolysin